MASTNGQSLRRTRERDHFPRIRLAVKLLSEGHYEAEVKRRLVILAREQGYRSFGKMQAAKVIRYAREVLRGQINVDRDELRGRVLEAYWSVYRDPNIRPRERLEALKALSILCGLNDRSPEVTNVQTVQVIMPDFGAALREAQTRGELPASRPDPATLPRLTEPEFTVNEKPHKGKDKGMKELLRRMGAAGEDAGEEKNEPIQP